MNFPPRRPAALLLSACLLTWLGGCASLAAPTGANAGAAGAAGPSAAARPPVPAALPASGVPPGSPQPGAAPTSSAQPFATVIKDAKKIDGLFTLYQRDEKVWIELRPEDFGKPFFLSPKIATGIGEARLYGGTMDTPQVIEFRRIHNQVQMIARNTRFIAKAGTPEGRAVAAAFSPSLLASAAVASQPQPERKSVLVEVNALFVNDMLGLGMDLQRAFRQGYAFDARNSAITSVRGKPDMVALEVLAHFATGSIAVPQPGMPPGAPVPTTPQSLPDPRSMFMTLHYSIARLPDVPMAARASDPRIGYFTARQQDFGDDLARTPTVRHVQRWRLEKKDPNAALSEPVKPIVYWLDRTIPLKYRGAISAGILEWNKAFEKIGFRNAIEVRVQPDDADFDTLDFGIASVRWMTNSVPAFGAIGPSHVDPRSGEILDADIAIESLSSRNRRALRAQVLSNAIDWNKVMQAPADLDHERLDPRLCDYADQAADQMAYALDVLEARGDLDPAGPEAEKFVLDYLTATTLHEVGHTLGLRHNFRASRIYSDADLSNPEFTRTHAMTGSVMEYSPVNLARPGDLMVQPFQLTLGPYDYWAIEYAYKPMERSSEVAELRAIAARSGEAELAYGTDEDNFLGIDPEALHFDLGNDVPAFAKKRIAIAHDLFKRQETRTFAPGQDYTVLRRSLGYAVGDVASAVGVLGRQIGGLRTLRDQPGSGRDPLQPVPAAQQREALDVIARGLFAADSFIVSPALQRRLAPDFEERGDAAFGGDGAVATDFSLTQRVFAVQRASLGQLMSDAVAARIIDSQDKATRPADAFQLSELYGRLQREIWSELGVRADISAARRELQREHVNRLAAGVLRPGAASRADSRSLLRVQAQSLLAQIQTALGRRSYSADTVAHLQDSADTLTQALSAKLQRAGV
ncbi:MAG: zinc-dependent metalloprotease [Caldimonas sp.]